jgi:hypothetical protein
MDVVSAWLVAARGAMNGRPHEALQSPVTIDGADRGVSLKLVHVNANVGDGNDPATAARCHHRQRPSPRRASPNSGFPLAAMRASRMAVILRLRAPAMPHRRRQRRVPCGVPPAARTAGTRRRRARATAPRDLHLDPPRAGLRRSRRRQSRDRVSQQVAALEGSNRGRAWNADLHASRAGRAHRQRDSRNVTTASTRL